MRSSILVFTVIALIVVDTAIGGSESPLMQKFETGAHVKMCGKSLMKATRRVCPGGCTEDANKDLSTTFCAIGGTKEQLKKECCP